MHEASVAMRILDAVEGYGGLKAVFVTIGRQSCVHPDMLRAAFDAVKHGTPADCCELVAMDCPGEDIRVISIEVENANYRYKQKHIR